MKECIVVVCAVAISIFETLYTRWYEKRLEKEYTKKQLYYLTGGYCVANIITGLLICYFLKGLETEAWVRWLLLIWGMIPLVWIDIRNKLVPNHILLALLIIRIGFLIYELLGDTENIQYLLPLVLLGAAIGGGIMLLVYALSRGGLGFGDVKLFAILGLYVGSGKIIEMMMYTFILSALFGLVLLISRKAHLKDELPMAPFAYAGVVLTCVFLGF